MGNKFPDRPIPLNAKLVPDNARKVFTGKLYEVYQWDQKMFDGTTKVFEMLKRADTAVIIPVVGEEIVIIKEQQPDIATRDDVPVGRVDANESVKDTALRDLKEETGIEPVELFYVDSEQNEVKIESFVHIFLAKDIKVQHTPSPDNGEKIEVTRVSIDNYIQLCKNFEVKLAHKLFTLLVNNEEQKFKQMLQMPEKFFQKVY